MHLFAQPTVEELTEQRKARDIVRVLMFLGEVPYRWDAIPNSSSSTEGPGALKRD
jgi:hypothetical protein